MRTQSLAAVLTLGLVACSSSAGPPSPPSVVADERLVDDSAGAPSRRSVEGSPLAAPEAGPCGGLAALTLDGEHRALDDRLRLRVPAGSEQLDTPHNVMSAPESSQTREMLSLRAGDARLTVVLTELFRTAGDELATHAEQVAPAGWRPRALAARGGMRGIAVDPVPLRDHDGDVILQEAWLAGADDLVRHITVVTSPGVASTGGCVEFARRIVSGIAPGARELQLDGGERVLYGDLAIQLRTRHALVVDEGPDFAVYRVIPILPIGALDSSLGIYTGGHPSFHPEQSATERVTHMLGRHVTWYDVARGSDAIIEMDRGRLHVFFAAPDRGTRKALRVTAESLHRVTPSARAPLCDAAAGDAALLGNAERVDGAEVARLLRADRVALSAVAIGEPRVAEIEAFRRVLARDDAPRAFLHLAAHGSTAGRVYGLAGLRLVDRVMFQRAACAARSALDAEVTVRDVCDVSVRAPWSLIERTEPEAIRGEEHWGHWEWGAAHARGTADVVGGALPRKMALGGSGEREMDDAVWLAGSAGLAGLAPTPIEPARGEPSRDVRLRPRAHGGFCTVRSDGRVACWGGEDSSARERVRLLPDVVRHPLDVEDGALDCMLDASHERTCWFAPALERHYVRERCGVTLGEGPVVRRFDDGPWRRLLHLAGRTCGLHEDHSLRCFAHDRRSAAARVEGIGDAWRVPIEGRVAGAVDGDALDAYAWTEDGRVLELELERDGTARQIGRFHEVARIVAGGQGTVFAELRDGRVLAWGSSADDPARYWQSFGPRQEAWIELDELHGAQISLSDHHGCARWPEGRVRCWGSNRYGELGPGTEHDESPRDVEVLRGASELFLVQQVTCGRMRDDVLRCIGLQVPGLAIEPVASDHRGPLDIHVPR